MKYANHIGYSDINPYEVVRIISDKTIEIREMKATRDESYKPEFIPGGFSAVCINQNDQKWIIESDDTNPVIRIRKSIKKGWADKHGHRFVLDCEPVKFYDYNF